MYTDASPNPATTRPAMRPVRWEGNHLTAAGVAAAYPMPIPAPASTPNPRTNQTTCVVKLARMRPRPVDRPPASATHRGPKRSCARPAGTIVIAKTRQAME